MKFRRIFIEITNVCNLSCGFCAVSSRKPVFMDKGLFESAVRQAGPLAGAVSLHVLGEPFMHPLLPEFLVVCAEHGAAVNLVTNGTLINKYGPDIFKAGSIRQVSVSLHALASLPEDRRAAALDDILAFACARPGGVTASLRLRGDWNGEFERWVLAGIGAAFNTRIKALERGAAKLAPGVYLNSGDIFSWPAPGGKERRQGCLGLKHNFAILSDGRVVPCCVDFDGNMAFGDINSQPLADILAGPRAAELAAAIASRTNMPEYCRTCGFCAPR